jgi:hypothetical protein
MLKPLPDPLYACAYCADEYSWPPEDLFWSENTKSWVCDNCWEGVDEHWEDDRTAPGYQKVVERGITLSDELKSRGLIR